MRRITGTRVSKPSAGSAKSLGYRRLKGKWKKTNDLTMEQLSEDSSVNDGDTTTSGGTVTTSGSGSPGSTRPEGEPTTAVAETPGEDNASVNASVLSENSTENWGNGHDTTGSRRSVSFRSQVSIINPMDYGYADGRPVEDGAGEDGGATPAQSTTGDVSTLSGQKAELTPTAGHHLLWKEVEWGLGWEEDRLRQEKRHHEARVASQQQLGQEMHALDRDNPKEAEEIPSQNQPTGRLIIDESFSMGRPIYEDVDAKKNILPPEDSVKTNPEKIDFARYLKEGNFVKMSMKEKLSQAKKLVPHPTGPLVDEAFVSGCNMNPRLVVDKDSDEWKEYTAKIANIVDRLGEAEDEFEASRQAYLQELLQLDPLRLPERSASGGGHPPDGSKDCCGPITTALQMAQSGAQKVPIDLQGLSQVDYVTKSGLVRIEMGWTPGERSGERVLGVKKWALEPLAKATADPVKHQFHGVMSAVERSYLNSLKDDSHDDGLVSNIIFDKDGDVEMSSPSGSTEITFVDSIAKMEGLKQYRDRLRESGAFWQFKTRILQASEEDGTTYGMIQAALGNPAKIAAISAQLERFLGLVPMEMTPEVGERTYSEEEIKQRDDWIEQYSRLCLTEAAEKIAAIKTQEGDLAEQLKWTENLQVYEDMRVLNKEDESALGDALELEVPIPWEAISPCLDSDEKIAAFRNSLLSQYLDGVRRKKAEEDAEGNKKLDEEVEGTTDKKRSEGMKKPSTNTRGRGRRRFRPLPLTSDIRYDLPYTEAERKAIRAEVEEAVENPPDREEQTLRFKLWNERLQLIREELSIHQEKLNEMITDWDVHPDSVSERMYKAMGHIASMQRTTLDCLSLIGQMECFDGQREQDDTPEYTATVLCQEGPPLRMFDTYYKGTSQCDWPAFRKTFETWSKLMCYSRQTAKSMLLTCMVGQALERS